ncbi:MAG: hypothetical protein VYA46_02450 [Verrucomicrobiota bacterium]|nr:hypothetical protein [Verrucomicrobiota bacterium]
MRASVDHHTVDVVDLALVARQRGLAGAAVVIVPDPESEVAYVADDKGQDGEVAPDHHAG